MRGEIASYVVTVAVALVVVDWCGFLWGTAHREEAFVIAQIGFFIIAHALYTKERR